MLFVSADDFFVKAQEAAILSREEEKFFALKKEEGDAEARERIIHSYLPLVSSYIKQFPKELYTLETVYSCIHILERGVDTFRFQQDGELFSHYLGQRLRQFLMRRDDRDVESIGYVRNTVLCMKP